MCIPQSLSRLGRILRGAIHLRLGRLWLLLGKTDRARKAFQGVLECRGDDFDAYFQLGRIALRENNVRAALREMAAARRTNPVRFARLRKALVAMLPGRLGTSTAGRRTEAAPSVPLTSGNDPAALGPFELPADGNGLLTGTWSWFRDSTDQGGGAAGCWGPVSREGRAATGEDPFPWQELGEPAGEAWSSETSESDPPARDCEPLDELDDFEVEFAGLDEDGSEPLEEEVNWAESPLAAFYQELAGRGEGDACEEVDARSDFMNEAEEDKFRQLPPIRQSELDDLNWDELSSRLGDLD